MTLPPFFQKNTGQIASFNEGVYEPYDITQFKKRSET